MNPIIFIVSQIILWLSIALLIYSYVIFPLLLALLSRNEQVNEKVYKATDQLPRVSILMSLFNEEKVILSKLESLYQQKYPKHLLNVYIASDCSTDDTNHLVQNFINRHQLSHFRFIPFEQRQGKPGVINQIAKLANESLETDENHIFIITDASVILATDTVFHLIKHFKNKKIGLVDAHMQHVGLQNKGIAQSEDHYISKEVRIKSMESLFNGKMMGPFGGCYALRAHLFSPVPPNFLVDDFFLALQVLSKGHTAINELKAICTESVSQDITEEYRRKRRISSGNFQNLFFYKKLLFSSDIHLSFNYWSHKVLRWLGPFFIIISYLSNIFLSIHGNLFYITLLSFQTVLIFIIPIFDYILQQFNIHIIILRSIRYFFMMNLALLEGFFNYIKGIKSNVWQPTKRPDST